MPTKIVTADILNEVGDVLIENVTATVNWGGGGFRINGRWSVSFELVQPIEFNCFSHWIDSDEFWGEIVWQRTEAGRYLWIGIRELVLMEGATDADEVKSCGVKDGGAAVQHGVAEVCDAGIEVGSDRYESAV